MAAQKPRFICLPLRLRLRWSLRLPVQLHLRLHLHLKRTARKFLGEVANLMVIARILLTFQVLSGSFPLPWPEKG